MLQVKSFCLLPSGASVLVWPSRCRTSSWATVRRGLLLPPPVQPSAFTATSLKSSRAAIHPLRMLTFLAAQIESAKPRWVTTKSFGITVLVGCIQIVFLTLGVAQNNKGSAKIIYGDFITSSNSYSICKCHWVLIATFRAAPEMGFSHIFIAPVFLHNANCTSAYLSCMVKEHWLPVLSNILTLCNRQLQEKCVYNKHYTQ